MKKSLIGLTFAVTLLQAIAPSDFKRDALSGIVTDTRTGLQWQDDAVGSTANWQSALDRCEALSLGGKSDWRLPNQLELHGISDDTRFSPAIDPTFQNTVSSGYWSSTSYAPDPALAWGVYFSYGTVYMSAKTNSNYVRCVRGGQ